MKLQQMKGKVENVLQSPCSKLQRPAEAGPTSPAGA